MRKIIYLIILIILPTLAFSNISIRKKYRSIKLEGKMDYKNFEKAIQGYNKINDKKNDNLIAIIDYTKPSIEERFFLIDLKKNQILYKTLVAHGKNSGKNETITFSNTPNSYKSSLGFFLTENSYNGEFGYSLRLKGLEEGINSNAFERNIVIHGADYVSENFIKQFGFLGRTKGCPALPTEMTSEIINRIQGGTVVFVIGNDHHYANSSPLLASI
ncbi:MAG: murein L,D-transpeptidase catalytic domain family protein [Fusobacteriaceae bacterium]